MSAWTWMMLGRLSKSLARFNLQLSQYSDLIEVNEEVGFLRQCECQHGHSLIKPQQSGLSVFWLCKIISSDNSAEKFGNFMSLFQIWKDTSIPKVTFSNMQFSSTFNFLLTQLSGPTNLKCFTRSYFLWVLLVSYRRSPKLVAYH